ncbi:MAG TPA: methyltransferase domain-containing protein [Acidimicrobiia bacterium]|nr:methyltransferase domain-containing protein [Acidimicrobiia bacterium]
MTIIDPSNTEQARAWDGDEGAYWAGHAEHFDRSLAGYHDEFLAAAAITANAVVLDVGCGTGRTTRDAARLASSGRVLGVDLSSRMLEYARKRAADEGLDNVEFEQADAQVHPFEPGAFDMVISRTGAMFFGDPVAAFVNLRSALRPGGSVTLLTWQPPAVNEWIRELSGAFAAGRDVQLPPLNAPGPFALSDPARIESILGAAGFRDVAIHSRHAPMWFGTDVDDAASFMVGLMGWMLEGLDDTGREQAVDALRATLARHQATDGVAFGSAAWIAHAVR